MLTRISKSQLIQVCLGLLTLMALPLYAATPVSGVINTSTNWTKSQSPYTVTADVIVDASATLTIEAGVKVLMNLGTNLIVQNGILYAVGTQASPISITSFRDDGVSAVPPQPGDWGEIRFQSTSPSTVQYADIAYGRGVRCVSSSPDLTQVTLRNHQGAAMAIDLNSSPTGIALSAAGNGLNGILVPAGDITSRVSWSITGIPYIVEGMVGVGYAPGVPLSFTFTPNSAQLAVNATQSMSLSVPNPAPTGGLTVTLVNSNPAIATVPASFIIPAGATSANFTVTGLATGTTSITARAPGYVDGVATITVAPTPIQMGGPYLLAPGLARNVTFNLPAPASGGGLNLTLQNSHPAIASVPVSVNVLAGTSLVTVPVTGIANGTTTLTVSGGGYQGTAQIVVDNIDIVLNAAADISLNQGGAANISVSLSKPAPVGITISLVLGNPAVATTTPNSISFLVGQTQATIALNGLLTGSATLTAASPGLLNKVINVTVTEPVDLVFQSTSRSIVKGGYVDTDVYRVIRTGGYAGPQPVTVTLTSSNPALVTVPATVTIPAGATGVTFRVTGLDVTATPVTIDASANGHNAPVNKLSVSVHNPELSFTYGDGMPTVLLLGKGLKTTSQRLLMRTALGQQITQGDLVVNLRCEDPAICSVPATVTIPAGASSVGFVVTGINLGQTNVIASAPAFDPPTPLPVEVITSHLIFTTIPSLSPNGNGIITVGLGFAGPFSPIPYAANDIIVSLTSSSPGVATVTSSVTIPAGSSTASAQMQSVTLGTTTVTATSPGFTPAVTDVVVTPPS